MNRKTVVIFSALLSATLLLTTGCGGGGGGGETATTPTTTQPTASTVESAYALVESGNSSTAISSFNQILGNLTLPDEKKRAYSGLGWAYLKNLNLSQAKTNFEQALAISDRVDIDNELRVGYAAVNLAQGDSSGALSQLQVVTGGSSNFTYHRVHDLGFKDADVHAMLASAYAMTGNSTEATTMKNTANSLDATESGTMTDSIVQSLTLLGF